ncbi:hypothetical protein [Streptomyces syringium]|uniref:hypothetical protein n=1 Tax=Streptomyces syringium TaxID=76729 RepID=UPI003451DF41
MGVGEVQFAEVRVGILELHDPNPLVPAVRGNQFAHHGRVGDRELLQQCRGPALPLIDLTGMLSSRKPWLARHWLVYK